MFTKEKLKSLIIPLIIEQILVVLVGMVDVVMVSSVGEAAVSGVSLVDMVNVLIINIFAAIATGGAVVCSQFIGQKDKEKGCRSAKQLLIITVLISILIVAGVLTVKRPLLRLLFGSIEDDVMKNALIYLSISALSFPFLAVYNSCAALFRSMGNSKISMIVSFIMNIINVIGILICINGFKMGVEGVAYPTLISRFTAAFIMLILVSNKKNDIYIDLKGNWKLDFYMIKKILNIGIPNGFENCLFQMGRVLVVSIISVFGTVQIAANAVANNLDSLGCIPGQAMNLAMVTIIGQCVGARDYEQAVHYAKKLIKITYIITIALNSTILITMPLILKLYQLSPETIKLTITLVFIHDGIAMLLWPCAFTLPNALRAANDVKYTMVISIFSMFAFRILFSYILGIQFGMGAIGVWIAMIIDWIFRAGAFIIRFLNGKWKLHQI